jgi:hypothetical protein
MVTKTSLGILGLVAIAGIVLLVSNSGVTGNAVLHGDTNLKAGKGLANGYNPNDNGRFSNDLKECCESSCDQVSPSSRNGCVGSCMSEGHQSGELPAGCGAVQCPCYTYEELDSVWGDDPLRCISYGGFPNPGTLFYCFNGRTLDHYVAGFSFEFSSLGTRCLFTRFGEQEFTPITDEEAAACYNEILPYMG